VGIAISTRGLGRDFDGRPAVRDLDLSIAEGELYGFLGPNGAGKTTTLRLLTGLLRPTAGTLQIAGRDYATADRDLRRITGFVPDTPPLYEHLTGRQYVGLVASLWDIDRKTRDARADHLFHLLELDEVVDDLCRTYSHGTRRKLHVAAVLTTAPRVLFLDEPTTGLDPLSSRRLKDLLREQTRGGATVMFSTHVLDAAEQICDRVGILAQGRLLTEGTLTELRAQRGQGSLEDIFLRLTDPAAAALPTDGPAPR
jgi:ABC-2 type transport system ATP-binding protein